MSTRLLEANQQQVASATDPAERAQLLQDRAILQARLGRTEEALRTLDLAEQDAPADLAPALALRFAYARAIARYFGKHFAEAREQMTAVLERARPGTSNHGS